MSVAATAWQAASGAAAGRCLARRARQLRRAAAGGRQNAAAAAQDALPTLYFGTMTFGWSQASSEVDSGAASAMLRSFLAGGGKEVDTARIYSGGDTEKILGGVLREPEVAAAGCRLATKAHPSQPGGLSAAGIRGQLQDSMDALGVEKVDVLYLHQPDPEHDLSESLSCVHELILEGKVKQLGMSNYRALEVERACELCRRRGWTAPSFYQGLYNPLNRLVEEELLPVLRAHGVGFIAYNPLAAGLLSGKHRPGGEVLAGRFRDNPNYLPRFYTPQSFQALEAIRAQCEQAGVGLVPAAYSWLLRHSALRAELGDGLLLGASSPAQLAENLAACRAAAALPPGPLAALDAAWEVCKEGAFPYWRSYSKDQPDREDLHPGASYDAAKKK